MKKLFFVILHYQNIDDTINCINSIKELNKCNQIEYKIIVIDNKSPNNTGIQLEAKYRTEKNVDCILLDKNYGFSIANNIGYKKAKEKNADIICVINNDIIFEDKEFFNKLNENLLDYDIVAPDIINKDGQHQNPLKEKPYSLKKAYKNLLFELFTFIIVHIPMIRAWFISYNKKRNNKWMDQYYKNKKISSVSFVPFGAFIIYANNWIKNEDVAFVSDTFMYAEEDMLGLYINKKKYKLHYDDTIHVRHLEGQSTKKINKDEYKLVAFRSKNKAKALKRYIKYYKKIKNEER